MSKPSAEQILPTRWVLRGIPSRKEFAAHCRGIKKRWGREYARGAIRQALWVGCLPSKRGKQEGRRL